MSNLSDPSSDSSYNMQLQTHRSIIRSSMLKRYTTERMLWVTPRILDSAPAILLRPDPRIYAATSFALGLFLALCFAEYDVLRENSRRWIAILLLLGIGLALPQMLLGKLVVGKDGKDKDTDTDERCIMAGFWLSQQCILNIALSVSCLRSDWGDAVIFSSVHILLFCATLQGVVTLTAVALLAGFLVECMIRLLCRSQAMRGLAEVTEVQRERPLLAEVRHGWEVRMFAERCVMCMGRIRAGDLVAGMKCGATHTFHFDCLAKHLSADQARCPICEQELNLR